MLTAKFIVDVLAVVPEDMAVVFEYDVKTVLVPTAASYEIDEIRITQDCVTLKFASTERR